MTTAKERMLSYLPPYYGESRVMNAILEAQGEEIDKLNYALDEVLKQFFVLTATWGLGLWEEQHGLPVNEDLDYQARRQQVLAKKRGGRSSLTKVLQAVEPTITLAWGRVILPFAIESNEDIYDFGPLIVILERCKPAHLGYSFRLLSTNRESGYVIYANHRNRGKVNLELRAGSVKTGRWPRWSSPGQRKDVAAGIQAVSLTGNSFFNIAATTYSGPVQASSSEGVVLKTAVGISGQRIIGTWVFPYSGEYKSGIVPESANSGSLRTSTAGISGLAVTGQGHSFPCGPYYCGEEVA